MPWILGPHGQKKTKARNPAAHPKKGNQEGQAARLVQGNPVQRRRVKEDARHRGGPTSGATSEATEKERVGKETDAREAIDVILIRMEDRTNAKSR